MFKTFQHVVTVKMYLAIYMCFNREYSQLGSSLVSKRFGEHIILETASYSLTPSGESECTNHIFSPSVYHSGVERVSFFDNFDCFTIRNLPNLGRVKLAPLFYAVHENS